MREGAEQCTTSRGRSGPARQWVMTGDAFFACEIQPRTTEYGAVEKAERQVYEQADALRKLESISDSDTSKLPTAKGVR